MVAAAATATGGTQHPALGERKSSATRISTDVHNVSQVWAKRLEVISPAQGKLSLTDPTWDTSAAAGGMSGQTESTVQPMAIKQKWPDWLVDESFDVIKVTKFGQRYPRTLKLTQYHILGASDQGITKVF